MTQTRTRPVFFEQRHIQPPQQYLKPPLTFGDSSPYTDLLDIDLGVDSNHFHYNSLSASPVSTQSLLSQYSPLSTFESLPTPILAEPSLSYPPRQSSQSVPPLSLATDFPIINTNPMQTDRWVHNGQLTPRSAGHFSHQRDSSRSSMGSNGPPSPFSHNFANPQIAMSDSNGDFYHGSGSADDMNYQLATKSFPAITHDNLFTQRVRAANDHHMSVATNSPVSSVSCDQSPFRTGSPLANIPLTDFRSTAVSNLRYGPTQQQLRNQSEAMQKTQAMRPKVPNMTPPQTISPKDAVLGYHEPEGDANFPLFSPQNTGGFDANAINKAAAAHSQQVFGGIPLGNASNFNPFHPSVTTGMPAQQFPFMAQPQSTMHLASDTSSATTRLGSADTGATEPAHDAAPKRPANTRADGGTYTCTYHGCTRRFDTPALLQKHKREGHRQAHGLSGPRRPDGSAGSLVNTQAGPHRCDRVNPSTGKPCNTVFSRPYDLTRHEHTIHNANKQKVRCDICTDEKAFSRADALTRHYRVCHPHIELPGKQRKRAARGA